ncbi:MAG: inorganic phosphate transporter [Patescibacteria group bacterium]|nr:inorganic phosphate transporter [Patescibacteria group bacterium]
MSLAIITVILLVATALLFTFTNGFTDSASQVATIIFSRSLGLEVSLLIAAIGNFVGAYFLGTAVAQTIGSDIINPHVLQQSGSSGVLVVFAALISAISWNVVAWYLSIPSSSSHALIGGLIGSFLFSWGPNPINWDKVIAIVIVMLISPIVAFAITYFFTQMTLFFSQWSSPKINKLFKDLQVFSLIAQSLSHGTNDTQKTIGVISFSLVILGMSGSSGGKLLIPNWVVLSCSLAMFLGTLLGGKGIIKKIGSGLYKIRPIHGFASQTSSSIVIYLASILGFPVSTGQIMSSSVMGAGAAFRPKMIRWQIAQEMVAVWVFTIPATALLAGILFLILNKIF